MVLNSHYHVLLLNLVLSLGLVSGFSFTNKLKNNVYRTAKPDYESESVSNLLASLSKSDIEVDSSSNSAQDQVKSRKKKKKRERTPIVPWICCVTTTEIERAIDMYVRPGDTVLEIGSNLASTTEILCQSITSEGFAYLFDTKRKEATSGRNKQRTPHKFVKEEDEDIGGENTYHDRCEYIQGQSFDEWRCILHKEEISSFDVIVLDLGALIGNDLVLLTVSILEEITAHLKTLDNTKRPRAILIKSTILSSISRRLIHARRLLTGVQSLPTAFSQGDMNDKMMNKDPYFIATVGVNEYRKTIPFVVQKNDGILEVGCHFGTTTKILYDHTIGEDEKERNSDCGFCIGVDIGQKVIETAMQNYPHVHFCVADAWRTGQLGRLPRKFGETKHEYDIIYVDIGGLSGPDGLLESISLLDSLAKSLEPRGIVIKSKCLQKLSSSLRPFSAIWQEKQRLEYIESQDISSEE